MPKVTVAQMLKDFFKITDCSLFDIRESMTGVSSWRISNKKNNEASLDFQKIWYVIETLNGNTYPSACPLRVFFYSATKEYELRIPDDYLSIGNTKEDRAMYKIRALCANYLMHIHEIIKKEIIEHHQKLDIEKTELTKEQERYNHYINNTRNPNSWFLQQKKRISNALRELDAKYITPDCSLDRMDAINNIIKNYYRNTTESKKALWVKETVFCSIFRANTIKDVAEILRKNKYALSRFRKTALEEQYDFLDLLKIMAIVMTFPVSIPILAAVSYKNRGTLYFYKPDSQICIEKIQEEMNHSANTA